MTHQSSAKPVEGDRSRDALTPPAGDLVERLGCCEGCGSTRTQSSLEADGYVSCCPERKMLTAKEWATRAQAAEASAQQMREALEGLLKAFGDPLTRRALGGHNERQQLAVIAAHAALSASRLLKDQISGEGSPSGSESSIPGEGT